MAGCVSRFISRSLGKYSSFGVLLEINNPPAGGREGSEMFRSYARTTFAAWKPLGPFSRSNSTVSPSLSVR
jgi:hypothetical protein